jgi:hypothetical protein
MIAENVTGAPPVKRCPPGAFGSRVRLVGDEEMSGERVETTAPDDVSVAETVTFHGLTLAANVEVTTWPDAPPEMVWPWASVVVQDHA